MLSAGRATTLLPSDKPNTLVPSGDQLNHRVSRGRATRALWPTLTSHASAPITRSRESSEGETNTVSIAPGGPAAPITDFPIEDCHLRQCGSAGPPCHCTVLRDRKVGTHQARLRGHASH